ncbi:MULTISPECIES: ABC transporter substrate-binding protein [unclassified Paenibacillus]|uniref:ABC transporter substrate-binding protein n=1 Tax=unclassified Paenibacillus TaxID=185978 RepID=UPI001AE2FF52|nr:MULTISPECIES: ABC transporter substrate-binding protein [unclassified Paenibacillus]MBP1155629.1 polar amino acid transport system substrate-binding protein [Paenibacillus sp. PvP091]MBP1168985.1 polar amino acid transport system substrate-binding protein [Paenibacillus sp. PvR098]MBP2440013.1 polar amino acid transport system substrate-binding protein [Paenibacillus sp. PvP052]
MIKNKAIVLMLMSLILIISACGTKPAATTEQTGGGDNTSATAQQNETKLEKIKKAGKIVMGTSADYPPYEFHKEINKKDEIVGFDIEIAKAIAKDLGVELEMKDMRFEGLLAALEAGNVDFVISGMTPTPERMKAVDFTNIYYTAVQKVVIRAEDKDKFTTVDSLQGLKVGAQKGATQEKIVKEQMPGSEVKPLGKISDLMLELKNKKVDALVVELPVAEAYLSKNKDLVIADIQLATEDSGSAIALKKGNPDLVEAMNKTLDKLINDKSIDKFVTEANELVEEQ